MVSAVMSPQCSSIEYFSSACVRVNMDVCDFVTIQYTFYIHEHVYYDKTSRGANTLCLSSRTRLSNPTCLTR